MTINDGKAEISEYDRMKGRSGQPYSLGHRIMYDFPIKLMTETKQRILDVGFGIGYGLEKMVVKGIIADYVGIEPDDRSFAYVAGKPWAGNVRLIHGAFPEAATGVRPAQQVFCIEVIEHVAMGEHIRFLAGLRALVEPGGTLWLSTPDATKNAHGARAAPDWESCILAAGFRRCTIHEEQWTTMFVCQ